MRGFVYASYKHQSDQALLDRLSEALFVLKTDAQGRLAEHGLTKQQVERQRVAVGEFLDDLTHQVRLLRLDVPQGEFDIAYVGLAERFIKDNPHDIDDRLDELGRLLAWLRGGQPLRDHDFWRLDRLQALLEEEAAEGVRSLYRL